MTRSKEAWFSEELLNARLSMQNMEGVSRETVGALVGLIDEAVVGKVSLWQRRIAELEAALRFALEDPYTLPTRVYERLTAALGSSESETEPKHGSD